MNKNHFNSCARFTAFVLLVSLVFESTNLLVRGSIEASSPEERHENDLSLSGPVPSSTQSIVDFSVSVPNGFAPNMVVSPLVTPGVMNFQPNPASALIAAAFTMMIMSWKETGKVDLEGLGYILNSSDFYVGLVGSISAATSQKGVKEVISFALKQGMKTSPNVLTPALSSRAAQQIGNIANGFSYTLAVSSGFEYASQLWKHATRNIPEAQTVTGFVKADSIRKKQVGLNLLYYFAMEPSMQKRIFASVKAHRIMTFEFIATNIAMYAGGQIASIIVNKYGAGSPLLKKIGPTLGAITGGLLVQAIPSSWTNKANGGLIDLKLASAKRDLEKSLKQIEVGVTNRFYPPTYHSTVGFFTRGADLQSDIERVLLARDLIASLELQLMSYRGGNANSLASLKTVFDSTRETFETLLHKVEADRVGDLQKDINQYLNEGKSLNEIRAVSENTPDRARLLRYYGILLDAAVDRSYEASKGAQNLMEVINQKPLDATDLSVFGFGS